MAVYGPWLADIMTAHLSGKTVKAMLVTSAYVQQIDHHFRSQVTGEASGTGYTAGGITATGVTVSYDAATDAAMLTCNALSFSGAAVPEVAGVIFYISTGTASSDILIAADTFPPVDASDGTFSYTPGTTGVVRITASA